MGNEMMYTLDEMAKRLGYTKESMRSCLRDLRSKNVQLPTAFATHNKAGHCVNYYTEAYIQKLLSYLPNRRFCEDIVKDAPVPESVALVATTTTTDSSCVKITGIIPDDKVSAASDIWAQVTSQQVKTEALVNRRYSQIIDIPTNVNVHASKKLLVVNGGNHEARTKQLAGIDFVCDLLRGTNVLYDADEILFTLKFGEAELLWKCRHQWKYKSILNPFHSFMRDLERVDDFDIAVGGHVHSGSHYAKFDHHSRSVGAPTDRYAFLIGSYEYHSKYAKQCGFSRHTGRGSTALIIFPDRRLMAMDSVTEAARYLEFAHATYPTNERPISIVLMSDLHLGNAYTDYQQIFTEVKTIRQTPGMYAMLLGDLIDNWVGKLEGIQRQQPISHDSEFVLLRSLLGGLLGAPEYDALFNGGH